MVCLAWFVPFGKEAGALRLSEGAALCLQAALRLVAKQAMQTDELNSLVEAFKKMDTNKDGKVSCFSPLHGTFAWSSSGGCLSLDER